MKILIACRLMSGFADSVGEQRWRPSGSPALYQLFNALIARGVNLQLLFAAKDPGRDFASVWPDRQDRNITIESLAAPVTVLAGTSRIPALFGRWRGHLSDLRQTWRIWCAVRRVRPDLLYVDRANILAGALVARFTDTPVVLRVLGITPAMKEMAAGSAPTHRLDRWSYRAPFALVIGTDEGSGTRLWLDRLLRPVVLRDVRINGVDRAALSRPSRREPGDGRLHVALVGRLDALKRCDEAVAGVLAMAPERRRRLVLHVVGSGDRLEALRQQVAAAGAGEAIIFHGAIAHEQVGEILAQCDLYISLNRQGNLSNANLEALAAGLAFILPEPDPASGTDIDTHRVIPEDAGIRLPADRLVKTLAETLERLVEDRASVTTLRAAAARAAAALVDWPTRMAWEADRLASIADRRPADIAIVIADLAAGGAQRVALHLAAGWVERGRRVDLVTLAGPDTDFFQPLPAIRRHIVGSVGLSNSFLAALFANLRRLVALRRALRASGAQTVVSFVAPTNVLAVLASRGLGIRLVISERNDPARQTFGQAWDRLRRSLYRHADVVTANSHGAVASLSAWVPAAKLAFVPNPVVPVAAVPPAARKNRILAVGRLHRQKGFDILLDAFARTAANAPGWQLEIIGDGPLRDALAAQAEQLGLSDRVRWRGAVAEIGPHYRDAAIFVLPSRYEGTPNVLLEAMAHGLAVIVSDASPGPLDLVEDNVNGRVVPAEDPVALAAAIDELIASPDVRQRLGEAARARVADMSPERVLAVWDAVLGMPTAGDCTA